MNKRENFLHGGKESYMTSRSLKGRVLESHFSFPFLKEGAETCYKYRRLEWLDGVQAFQNGGYQSSKGYDSTRRLVNTSGSERCLFYNPNLQCRSKVS